MISPVMSVMAVMRRQRRPPHAGTICFQFVLTPLFTVASEAHTHRLTTGRFGPTGKCALSLTQFE